MVDCHMSIFLLKITIMSFFNWHINLKKKKKVGMVIDSGREKK